MTQVQDTVKTHGMLEKARRVVVAFSGGPDSVCLLDVLYRLYHTEIELCLVYINHGLRPVRVLQREERMAENYAHDCDIPYQVITVKVSRGKTGLEAAARQARYAALHTYMREVGADRIALGHNLDDVIETFFMNLVRGSGTRGLQAIPPVRSSVIRPLIDVRKRAVLAYVKKRKLSYSMDATNMLPEFRRNMLRHRIIPQLLKINPELHAAIQREIALLRQDDACLEHQAQQAYPQVAHREKNHVLLDIKRVLQYNPAIASRILMRAVFAVHGSLEGFESKHFKAILGLTEKETSKRVNLVKGLRAQRAYDHIVIGKARSSKRVMVYLDPESDTVVCNDMRVTVKKVQQCKIIPKKPNREVFDLDQLVLPLFIRSRTTGDQIETKTGRQKMKKIYNEFKVPPHKRDRHVLLCDQQGILWVLGLKRAYRAFLHDGSRNMVVVEIENTDRRT